ncbi:hypothetical protein P4O66_004591 [Electrophorus voltai]|uniref:Uncharacterized protein n=1 Tax=Electrophorus voltai TaxID=2609070 RepID=A0AAD8ZLZ1_9TELE|nr:hypothetical protein P4O66_004591 [Electrophorus voltai]
MYADDVVGKKRAYSPNSSSECPSDSKKSRSASPKAASAVAFREKNYAPFPNLLSPRCSTENSQTPALEPAGHMTPEEHYRRMMSALNDHTSYDEQQQRLYQLATNMGIPGHEIPPRSGSASHAASRAVSQDGSRAVHKHA